MTAQQRQLELALVRSDYVDKGPEFDADARQRAHALIDRLSSSAAQLSDLQYLLALAEIASQADNGHDSVTLMRSPLFPAARLPVRMVWLGDRLFVARAAPGFTELVGGEVLNIGRWNPLQLAAHLRRYQGGKDVYRRWNLSWMFHNPALLNAIGATRDATVTSLRVRLSDGKSITMALAPIAASEMPKLAFPAGWWSATLSPDELAKHWRAAGDPQSDPLYLQQPDRYFRMSDLPGANALYVQFRSNLDVGEEKIAPFVEAVEQRLKSSPPQNLVLDLRFDTGGDNTTNRDLMRDIAREVPGRIFVLAGPYTFSAGIASEAALIHDGGDKVVVIGEEPGDRSHWWSEHEPVCLPYSKVCLDREVGYWDLVNGCGQQAHCFGDQFDVRIKTLGPSIGRQLTPADWRSGRDPLMDAVRQLLAEPTAAQPL